MQYFSYIINLSKLIVKYTSQLAIDRKPRKSKGIGKQDKRISS